MILFRICAYVLHSALALRLFAVSSNSTHKNNLDLNFNLTWFEWANTFPKIDLHIRLSSRMIFISSLTLRCVSRWFGFEYISFFGFLSKFEKHHPLTIDPFSSYGIHSNRKNLKFICIAIDAFEVESFAYIMCICILSRRLPLISLDSFPLICWHKLIALLHCC